MRPCNSPPPPEFCFGARPRPSRRCARHTWPLPLEVCGPAVCREAAARLLSPAPGVGVAAQMLLTTRLPPSGERPEEPSHEAGPARDLKTRDYLLNRAVGKYNRRFRKSRPACRESWVAAGSGHTHVEHDRARGAPAAQTGPVHVTIRAAGYCCSGRCIARRIRRSACLQSRWNSARNGASPAIAGDQESAEMALPIEFAGTLEAR